MNKEVRNILGIVMLIIGLKVSFIQTNPLKYYAYDNMSNDIIMYNNNNNNNNNEVTEDDNNNYDKRAERNLYGLNGRAYIYKNGRNDIKRLPVYNFGLGKRDPTYSFGLGKRHQFSDDTLILTPADLDHLYNNNYIIDDEVKYNQPYDLDLGKHEWNNKRIEQLAPIDRYNFGLGR